ncbi:MAG: DUF6273 domain-containing protein [Faecousia sp.]
MKKLILLLLALLVFPLTALAEDSTNDEAAISQSSLNVGDIVTLGHYEQDGVIKNGEEPIEWIVLDVDAAGSKALVVSKYSLDRLLYHSRYEPVTWETCDLRGVLNGEFLSTVFSSEEIERILYSQLHTEDNTEKGTKGGNDTVDRVFLLSAEEAENYFSSDKDRLGVPTTYLIQLCAYTNGLEYTSSVYWLRSPGDTQAHAAYVFDGRVNLGGWAGNVHKLPIRPAMWISMDAAS